MVTLNVRFSCEICAKSIMHEIRVGPNFFLGADQIPDGWVIKVEEYSLRAYCGEHASQAK